MSLVGPQPGQRRLLIGSLIDLLPILKQRVAGRGMFLELHSGSGAGSFSRDRVGPFQLAPFPFSSHHVKVLANHPQLRLLLKAYLGAHLDTSIHNLKYLTYLGC
jgi:hypothetical protein